MSAHSRNSWLYVVTTKDHTDPDVNAFSPLILDGAIAAPSEIDLSFIDVNAENLLHSRHDLGKRNAFSLGATEAARIGDALTLGLFAKVSIYHALEADFLSIHGDLVVLSHNGGKVQACGKLAMVAYDHS